MALSDSPMAQMMYRNALLNLSNGAVSEIDKTVLSSAPLPDEFIKPYLSEETDALTVMNLSYNSLSTWIEEAKKANYFSKHFVTLSRMIMSGVATMARGLVTLHARGEDLSQAPMSIQDLIGVGSYHIRKSYLGVLQTSRKNPEIGERLLLNQLSWTNTMLRLFKTKEKLETESSKCRVQSSNEKKIKGSASPELPGGNDVEAFEPFENDGKGLTSASALTAPGAYTEPRAYASFGKKSVDSSQLSVVGEQEQEQENEEGRMKNEVDSESSEFKVQSSNPSSGEKTLPESEIMSDTESPVSSLGTEIQEQGARSDTGSGAEENSSSFIHNSSFPNPPPEYFKILYRALKRSEGSEDGSITFMENEIYQLLADPVFCAFERQLAQDLRKAITT